jgi:uncharacterized membrane protein
MAAAGLALALGMLALDRSQGGAQDWLPWIYEGGADGAREVLGTVAASMLTVLSVTFSVTIVALTVASQQFGPRVLHNFIRKPGPQVVLGAFIGTFLFSLVVLRSVSGEDPQFVPHVSVTVSVVLAAASIAALIYFIQHVSASIQAANILAEVAAEIDAGIDRLFPDRLARGESDPNGSATEPGLERTLHDEGSVRTISAPTSGYIQAIDEKQLMHLAVGCRVTLRLVRRPGDFVVNGETLVVGVPPDRVTGDACRKLQTAFLIGPRRTPSQDVAFGLGQLLEIALRALSPSTNEPFLAVNCIDRLLQALSHLAERAVPSSHRYDEEGQLRVIAEPFTFAAAADEVFDALLVPASGNVVTATRLLRGMGALAGSLRRDPDHAAIVKYTHLLHREARDAAQNDELKARIDEAHAVALRVLQAAAIRQAGPR